MLPKYFKGKKTFNQIKGFYKQHADEIFFLFPSLIIHKIGRLSSKHPMTSIFLDNENDGHSPLY